MNTLMHTRVAGMSMIELLVAVLVMGIGVLGITALQMMSLQANRGALARAEAVQLAYDMMDRIRANPAGGIGEDYSGLDIDDNPPGAQNCMAGTCTQAQMVAFDQAVWKCSLGGFRTNAVCTGLRDNNVLPPLTEQPGLPDGDGSIVVNGGTGVVTITVQWVENGGEVRSVAIQSQN